MTAVLLLTTALMLAYANYQSHITHLDLAEISTALDAIHAEDATGRKLTSEELAVRSRRLATLSERLVMLRRK